MMSSLDTWVTWWFSNQWLTWGVGLYFVANLGVWPLGIFLEWYTHQPGISLVTWKGGTGSRVGDIAKTQTSIPFSQQIWDSNYGILVTTFGGTALFGGVVSALLFTKIVGMEWDPLSASSLFYQVVAMEVIADLVLYMGHRIQHEVPFLWKFHAVHHALESPTPLGAVYIHHIDGTLQGSLPIVAALAMICTHPIAAYMFVPFRLAGNVANHSGLDCWWLDLLLLRYSWLGRAKVSHHDSHHKYGGRNGKVMNLGENFWIWDWAFGTLSDRSVMREDLYDSATQKAK